MGARSRKVSRRSACYEGCHRISPQKGLQPEAEGLVAKPKLIRSASSSNRSDWRGSPVLHELSHGFLAADPVALHLAAPYTISDISDMPDAPVHDAGPPLIEALVWLVVPLAFFLSLIWAGAVLAAIVKGRGFELRERILHARKAGEPWLHYWLSIPGAIGNLTILAIASVDWVNGGPLRQSIYDLPLWWLPALLLLISLLVLWVERLIASRG